MGLAVGDWDQDGDVDLFVTHWIAQENALFNNMRAEFKEIDGKDEDTLHFTDVADQYGLGQIALDYIGWGTAFLDYDNDGRLDLLMANGSTFQEEENPNLLIPMRMQLFWNGGPEKGFFEVGPVSGEVFGRQYVGRGLAVGDYDNDGDPDAFMVVNGAPAVLLRNDSGNTNRWLKVRLVGSVSNRFGLGAKLRAVVKEKVMVRDIGAGSSYYSQHAVGEALFGLGKAEFVDTLEVLWQGGIRQQLINLKADQTVVVKEKGSGR
jgi:hypothetical protein